MLTVQNVYIVSGCPEKNSRNASLGVEPKQKTVNCVIHLTEKAILFPPICSDQH